MKRKRKPKVIHVHGRRWFERTNGNTYHSVTVWVDGEQVHRLDFAYGYGSMYEQNACDWLRHNGYMPGSQGDKYVSLSRYCREHGIKYVCECDDVRRKKDL